MTTTAIIIALLLFAMLVAWVWEISREKRRKQ